MLTVCHLAWLLMFMIQYIKTCLAAFTYRSSLFMAHDCQRQRLANNVTKVTEQGWAGEQNMASRHSIPQRIYVKEDKVKVQKKKKNRKREMTQPKRDGEPSTNKWDRKWEPSKWSESEGAVKQIGPMGARERTKAALLLIDCRISPIFPSGTVVRQWQMEADWTPEQKKGLRNLPWSCPQLWVTTPQHVPCLTGHGQAQRKEREGWGGLKKVKRGRWDYWTRGGGVHNLFMNVKDDFSPYNFKQFST